MKYILKKGLVALLLLSCGFLSVKAVVTDYQLVSPDKKIELNVRITDKIYYAVNYIGEQLMYYSPLSMTLTDGVVLGSNPRVVKASPTSVSNTIPTVWGIRKSVSDEYNQLIIDFQGNYSVVFRVSNDGVAYRFQTRIKSDIMVKSEEVQYRFLQNYEVLAHVVGDFMSSYEKFYTQMHIKDMEEAQFSSLPFMVMTPKAKIVITEADLYSYPGMYVTRPGNNTRNYINGIFPAYPSKVQQGGWEGFSMRVLERADYIAKTQGTRDFPWRVMIIAGDDKQLADNDLVYKLSRPAAIETSWIKPGKVSWDWWNDWNLEGVDFRAGINNRTYEYYIDFAAKNNIEYVILDEGWSEPFDLFLLKPSIDVKYLTDYAAKKNVKLILWCVWHVLDRQMQAALDMFKEWGVAGVKVDFIDRDDQLAIEFYERLAAECAKRNLLVDYHGCSKPTGLHRTYPNVINYEAVRGNEYNKFSEGCPPGHNVDLVFTRMITGPMDYTPGAMRNSNQGDFRKSSTNPMSHGTRCHQLGMYVVYYAPLQMLCDAPTQYEKYPDILDFISKVPTTWDQTVVLAASLREYVVIARQKGDEWYVGALNNWTGRTVHIDLSFLGEGAYTAAMLTDGINADRNAEDYQYSEVSVTKSESLTLDLKPGGGAAIRISKK